MTGKLIAKSSAGITALYTLAAVFTSAINICLQMATNCVYTGPLAIETSIFIGTVAVLPIRYLFDKRYIFAFQSKSIKHNGQLFLLYSFMGVITTGIFWAIEYAFHLIFLTDAMRYIGGAIGLSVSFCIKYQLDKNFVFINYDK